MKRFSLTLATLLVTLCALAQTKFWVCSNDGTQAEFLISKVDSISFTTPREEKCKASDYPQVTIGNQTWMAENYRCSKYDTESEAYNASWLTDNTVQTRAKERSYTAYYIDAADKSKWDAYDITMCGVNLSDEQISKLGYLYNWAAAVGVADGTKQTTEFISIRQGICPNGWHLPSMAEWLTLNYYICSDKKISSDKVGKHLKTTSGWFDNGYPQIYPQGLDSYGFTALPAGYSYGRIMEHVGGAAYFMTATLDESDSYTNYNMILHYDADSFYEPYDPQQMVSDPQSNYKFVGSSVRCVKNADIYVSPTYSESPSTGMHTEINVKSKTSWTATANQAWVTLSTLSGAGNAVVEITVEPSTGFEDDTAIVEFVTPTGVKATYTVFRKGKPLEDKCKASDYLQVTIGTQTWMAENYRCSKYDTESEAYNAAWLTNNTIPTSEIVVYTPYYTDAADKSKWVSEDYAGNLTDTQVKKLGYLYNWAAAVGVADGTKQTTKFSGKRQGICPNGWHLPSWAEWLTLNSFIYGDKKMSTNEVGKHLKTTTGWYYGGNGLDSYGFAALPAGYSSGSGIDAVGYSICLWTPDSDEGNSVKASFITLNYEKDGLLGGSFDKYNGQNVRCVKD